MYGTSDTFGAMVQGVYCTILCGAMWASPPTKFYRQTVVGADDSVGPVIPNQ